MPTTAKIPPFPPPGQYLESVRTSSRSLRLASNILIRPECIKELLSSQAFVETFHGLPTSRGLSLPLNFPTVLAELNVISILSLLNFGSGYDVHLHRATSRSAWDNIRAFVLSLYLTSSTGGEGDFLSSKGMQAITIDKVAESLGVSVYVEKPHDTIPGLTVGTLGGPMYEFVKLVTATLNETGCVLVDTGYPNLGSFVLEALRDGHEAKKGCTANAVAEFVLERFVRAIPAFRDMAVINEQPIYCFKNALFLLHAINLRFGAISPPPFPVPATTHISNFADSVTFSVLVHLGIIDISSSAPLSSLIRYSASDTSLADLLAPASEDELNRKLTEPRKEGAVVTSAQAYVLRAASIETCELIIETAHSLDTAPDCIKNLSLARLDIWARTVAKDRLDYRNMRMFTQQDTVVF